MTKSSGIKNEILLKAGLDLMQQCGKPLTKIHSPGRSMLYATPNGETVRARTCNDHVLIVVADQPTKDAKLNIEGTDWLLVVMPEVERTPGNIIAYLVPTEEAVREARHTHQEWLASNPRTKGSNTTWNLWFRKDAPAKAQDFATKWEKYRLKGTLPTINKPTAESYSDAGGGDIRTEVENARQRIAKAAGVSLEAVKITIDFSL